MTTGTGYQNGRAERRPTMTAEEATHFPHRSALNAAIVASGLPCGCEPYRDVYTYNRWLGLGMQVQRGQHAIKLAILKEVDEIDEDGPTGRTMRVRARAAVFCRHQVAAASNGPARPLPAASERPPASAPVSLSYGGSEVHRTRKPAADNATVDGIMAGFEVVA